MKHPIVSIIVPVYNVSQYLDQCLDSLVNQTLRDIEIICVNDASTDNSLDILRSWEKKDSRIKIISLPENRMLGAARNIGIKEAAGEYLGFLDSDDYISYDFYQMLVEAINSDSDVVTTKCTMRFDETSEKQLLQFKNSVDINNQESVKKSITAYGCRLCASLFRRLYIIDKQFFFPEGVYFEDSPTVQCMFLAANHITVVDNKRSFWYYRINPSSIVHSDFSDKKFSDRLLMLKLKLNIFEKYGFTEMYKEEWDYRFFTMFYYNTIYLLLFRKKDLRLDLIRHVYQEYIKIVGKFPDNVYMKGIKDLNMLKIIGKYPILGLFYKIVRCPLSHCVKK